MPGYFKLVYNFPISFEFFDFDVVNINAPKVINFQLFGTSHSMSITDFNVALEFIEIVDISSPSFVNAFYDFPDEFDPLIFLF